MPPKKQHNQRQQFYRPRVDFASDSSSTQPIGGPSQQNQPQFQ